MSKLTIKQEKFCNFYVETGNASEAYRQSFSCEKMKSESVNRKAVELLNNGKITARVKQLQEELKKKSDITKEEAVKELTSIVRSRVTSIINLKGNNVNVKDLSELPDDVIACIHSIKQTTAGIEIKLHDKIAAIDRLCKMLGWDTPVKNEHAGPGGKDLISSIQIVDQTGLFR